MKIINFNGSVNVDYRIITKKLNQSQFAVVELYIKLPGNKGFEFYDCSAGMLHNNYKDNLRRALLHAEEMWGIDLLKLDISEVL